MSQPIVVGAAALETSRQRLAALLKEYPASVAVEEGKIKICLKPNGLGFEHIKDAAQTLARPRDVNIVESPEGLHITSFRPEAVERVMEDAVNRHCVSSGQKED